MDEELETKIGAVMCVHMDANRTLSQIELRAHHSCCATADNIIP